MKGELAFIEALRRLATHPAARNLDDDCAVIELGGEALVLTHDIMAEGVHYLPEQDPADIAWKLVAVNMSDLAAKGAEPLGVMLGYMFGRDDARFLNGLKEALDHFGAPLLGGDTVTGSGPQTLGLTAIGRATHRPVPARSGARPGDALCITGPVGAAMIGFEALRSGGEGAEAESRTYRRPEARLAEGRALAPHASAMMDISDGLLLDASRLAKASGVTLAVNSAAVPIATPEARRAEALRWGDDYQLLFTTPQVIDLPVPVHCIGQAVARSGADLLLDGKPPLSDENLGYQHRPSDT